MFHYKNMFCQIVRFDTDSSYRLLEEMLYKIKENIYTWTCQDSVYTAHTSSNLNIINFQLSLSTSEQTIATYRHVGIYMGIINFHPGNTLIRTWPAKRTDDTYLLRQCPSSSRQCWPLRVCSGLPWQNIALLPSVSNK